MNKDILANIHSLNEKNQTINLGLHHHHVKL